MNHWKSSPLTWLPVVFLVALSMSVRGGTATAAPAVSCGGWSLVSSPNPYAYYNFLSGVTAVSATDVWAVGYGQNTYAGPSATLVEHWTGHMWRVVASPSPSGGSLAAVAALSASNIWAVGQQVNGPLVEHWTGHMWRVVASPSPSGGSLAAVAALSASNIWAVGSFYHSQTNHTQTLIEHWNGTTWSIVPSPNVPLADNTLQGVAALSVQDAWAVGYYDLQVGHRLIEHWDGKRWSLVKQPHSQYSGLSAVAGFAATDIWAVGSSENGAITEHWNGSQWRLIPNGGGIGNSLDAVAARTTKEVWAVGFYFNPNTDLTQTITVRWNGKRWQGVPSPNVPSDDNDLTGVSAVSAHDVWAVGIYSPHNQGPNPAYTLIEHYC